MRIVDGPLAGLTARAVVVLDAQNKVLHTELVPEIAQEPGYDAAGGRPLIPEKTMSDELCAIAEKRGVPAIRRRVFLCCDQTKPNCCTKEQGLAS